LDDARREEIAMLTRRAFAALASFSAVAAQASAQAQGSPGAQTSAQASSQNATGARRAEIEALRARAEATHPRGREAAADGDWRARWDALAADAESLSDGAYFHRARQALAWFKDGHTTLLPFEFTGGAPAQLAHGPFALSLPVGVRVFHDGAYVVAARREAASLLGARITRVGSKTSAELLRAWARQWPGNDAWAHRWAGSLFAPAFLEALGAVADPAAPVRVEAVSGARRTSLSVRPAANAAGDRQPLTRTKTDRETWAEAAGDAAQGNYVRRVGEAIYISCDELGMDVGPFGAFTQACFAAMEDASPQRLIVDLRRNGGGNNYLFEALRKRIERSRFNAPGRLYVMISPRTFSAAQNAANRLERETFALFVGGPSGGAPNHYGDANTAAGAATGIVSLVSTLPWFDSYPQDPRDWIMPDVPSPEMFADWRDGRDPALAAALAHNVETPWDEWSRLSTFYFDRPSQSQPWRPFWRA
jgi:hypothetical protein